jgi:hypothetical protein
MNQKSARIIRKTVAARLQLPKSDKTFKKVVRGVKREYNNTPRNKRCDFKTSQI